MAKKDGKKKNPGTRNDKRKNGKAFSKKKFDDKGRALTGRGKPSGRSVKGMRAHAAYCNCTNCESAKTIDLTRVAA